jgi:hypothetical protein
LKGLPDKDSEQALPRLLDILQEAREAAREQLEAAWEIHIARVEEQLEQGWRKHLERIFDERFAQLTDSVGAEVERRVEDRLRSETERAVEVAERAVRRRVAEALALAARRLQDARSEQALLTALLESAGQFAGSVGVYVLAGSRMRFFTLSGETELLISSAPAVRETLDSGDCVVSLHTPRQISAAAAEMLPAEPGSKVTLIPMAARRRVLAVLCAVHSDGAMELGPLEVLAALATSAVATMEPSAELVTIGENVLPAGPLPEAEPLSEKEQEVHLRARRVARVQAAEIRLYESNAVKQGRADANLYGVLKVEIDTRRDAFRKEFVAAENLKIDYFHQELVRTLANDDESLLGPDYPGPLV